MKLAFHLHLGRLSISNTVSILDGLGVNRARSIIHNWVQKADIDPRDGRYPGKIALHETAIKVDGDRLWLFAAVEPSPNTILLIGLYSARATVSKQMFLEELAEKHAVDDAEFLVDGAPGLKAVLFELGMHFRHETFGERNPVERPFPEIKRRTNLSSIR